MKKLLFFIGIFCALAANAQTYLISFAGTGESSSVSTVKVENLISGASLTLNEGDILRLNVLTGVNSIDDKQSSELKIYPNPMTDNSVLQIYPPKAGNAVISVLDMTGKKVAQIQSYLENLKQSFRLSGLKNGFYLINVKGDSYQFSGKLLSNGKSDGTISIDRVNNIAQEVKEKTERVDSKGVQANVDMAYSAGNRLKFTGTSGIYSIVKTDIPTSDKTITFNFISCTDGDNNNYPIVEIGTQIWMAENLKTTSYLNGDLIETTTPATLNLMQVDGPHYYQWSYNGDESNVTAFGRLYTWYTVTDIRNVCPDGWHLPADDEWTTLTDFLTNNGYGYQGSGSDIAKSMAATSGWTTNPTAGNVGNDQASNNSSGFTALPGGYRLYNGPFDALGSGSKWWSSMSLAAAAGDDRYMSFDNSDVGSSGRMKWEGASVRCLKDN